MVYLGVMEGSKSQVHTVTVTKDFPPPHQLHPKDVGGCRPTLDAEQTRMQTRAAKAVLDGARLVAETNVTSSPCSPWRGGTSS